MRPLSYSYINSSFSTGDTNSVSSILDIPFFFNSRFGSKYRYEAIVRSIIREPYLKDYALDFSFNLKNNFKLLKSVSFFYDDPLITQSRKPSYSWSYLFSDSFRNVSFDLLYNFGPLFSEDLDTHQSRGYFSKALQVGSVYDNLINLSDLCLELNLFSNKLTNVLFTKTFSVDNFVSSYDSLSSFSTFETSNSFLANIKIPRLSFVLKGSVVRSLTFFTTSVDDHAIISSRLSERSIFIYHIVKQLSIMDYLNMLIHILIRILILILFLFFNIV